MKRVSVVVFAAMLLASATAMAGVTGVPVRDQYSGPLCFQYWLGGKLLGVDITTPSGVNLAAEIRDAIDQGYQIGATLWGDMVPPMNTVYAQNILCLHYDGTVNAVARTINVFRVPDNDYHHATSTLPK